MHSICLIFWGVNCIFCAVRSHSYSHDAFRMCVFFFFNKTYRSSSVTMWLITTCPEGEHTLNIGLLCKSLVWHASMEHEKARKASGKGRKGDNNSHLTDMIVWVDVVLMVCDHILLRLGLRATALSPGTSSEWWVHESKETCWLTQMLDNYNKQDTLILSTWPPLVQLQIKTF